MEGGGTCHAIRLEAIMQYRSIGQVKVSAIGLGAMPMSIEGRPDKGQSILGPKLVAVQNQYSPKHRRTADTLVHCGDLGLTFLPWSPLGGITSAKALGDKNAPFQQVADAHGVSPQQVALAWELAQGQHVIPIPGASRPETILDSIKAIDLELTPDELELLS